MDALRRPWQDLPSELLGLVLQRVQSHASRVRLRAVCRPWRASMSEQTSLPPLLPWLALRDGSFLSLPDGETHRQVLVPDDSIAQRVSTSSMLFLVHTDEGCSLMNPLSRESRRIELGSFSTRLKANDIHKVVVVSDHITAICNRSYLGELTISVRRPQSSTLIYQWIPSYQPINHYDRHYILDMALLQEKLYVLIKFFGAAHPLHLYAIDTIGDMPLNGRCIISTQIDDVDRWDNPPSPHYLVASGDRLLMVKQKRGLHTGLTIWMPKKDLFQVFEEVDMSSGGGRWREIDTLMGHALFLSQGCSESLLVNGGRCVGAQEDCIYFRSEHNNYDRRMRDLYSGIYNMKEGTVSPLSFDTTAARGGPWNATWFFPDDS